MLDAVVLAQEVTPYAIAAVGAYGAGVLTRVEDLAADATVTFGWRVIRRLTHGGGAVTGAVQELSAAPEDKDLQIALRLAIRKAIQADAVLAAEIAGWARPQSGGLRVEASGDRSVAIHANNGGTIITGDIHPGGL